MYVITGASGNIGSTVAQTLLDKGQKIRVIMRNEEKAKQWRDKGADIVIADLFDENAVRESLKGAQGAFLLLPPDLGRADFLQSRHDLADILIRALTDSNIPHSVFLSSVGAQLDIPTGPILSLAYLEKKLAETTLTTTLVRPGYFLENWGNVLPVVKQDSILPSFLHPLDRKIDMIATADIARTVVDALLAPHQTGVRIIEQKGTAQYSPQDIAQSLSRVLSKDITPIAVPQSAWHDTLTNVGMPEPVAALFVDMYENINNGKIDYEGLDTRHGHVELDALFANLVNS